MKYLLIFLIFTAILLWVERLYWKRRAELLELRVVGEKREISSFFDAWIEGRIESALRKARESKS